MIAGLFKIIITLSLLLGSVLGSVVYWNYKSSKPVVSGKMRVEGLKNGDAHIVRDPYGVPHIFGKSDLDVYFALGYAQAQDRFFQMDVTRRLVQGRLSELVGEKTFKLDVQNRIRGFNGVITDLMTGTDQDVRDILIAFSNGVNARLKQGRVAPEYALLLSYPDPWRPEDCIAVALAMTDNLVMGYEREIARKSLAEVLSPKQIAEFFPAYPDWAPRSLDDTDLTNRQKKGGEFYLPQSESTEAPQDGSNSWVVSGKLTASGAPLLANDPHLSLTSPGPFYLVRLALENQNIAGAVLPGAPFVVIGHNEKLAWTNTTNPVDAEDLLEEPSNGFRSVEQRVETIYVRANLFFFAEKYLQVYETPEGPILDPQWFDLTGYKKRVVLKSMALDRNNGIVNAIHKMTKAKTVADFIESGKAWSAPMTNMLVASTAGDIGLLATGRLPLRDAEGRWQGFVGWDEQPNTINPPSGMIATANNLIMPESYKHSLKGQFAVYRQARIRELLKATEKYNVPGFRTMQLDTQSVAVARILPYLLKTAQPETAEAQQLLIKMQQWNRDLAAELMQPLIYAAWLQELSSLIYSDELGVKHFKKFQGPRTEFLDEVLNGQLAHWCRRENESLSCADLTGPALDRAVKNLITQYGENSSLWSWGAAHQAVFRHPLFTGLPFLDELFTVRVPVGGDADSVFPAVYSFENGFEAKHGPGLRVIFDLSDLQSTQFVVAPGQAAHPGSPYFKNLIGQWKEGRGVAIRTDWDMGKLPPGAVVLTLAGKVEKK